MPKFISYVSLIQHRNNLATSAKMELTVKKLLFVIILTTLFLTIPFAQAKTVTYPANDPIFSINFPDDWNLEAEDDQLHATPEDESIYVGLWAMNGVENLEEALDALVEELDDIVQEVEIEDPEEMEINDISFVFIDGTGVMEDDTDVELSIAIFSPDGETFFINLFFGTPEMVEEHSDELEAILGSVEAL